jgi:hypothetical protein
MLLNQALAMSLNYFYTGRTSRAIEMLSQVKKVDPNNTLANEAMRLIVTGQQSSNIDRFIGKWWQGEELTGKIILVLCDQGMGDTLNLLRYVQSIKTDVKCEIVLAHYAFSKEMSSLMKCLEGSYGRFDRQGCHFNFPNSFDYFTNIMSLPCLLNGLTQDVYYPVRWHEVMSKTQIPEQRVFKAPNPLPLENGFNVGVAWQSNPENPLGLKKSIQLKEFMKIDDGKSSFHCVIPSEESCEGLGRHHLSNLLDTANLIASLDVIVTVDTVVLHLAGMMGKKALALLPFEADPRWGHEQTTLWHPSVELFRQNKMGDWSDALGKVKDRLVELRNSV